MKIATALAVAAVLALPQAATAQGAAGTNGTTVGQSGGTAGAGSPAGAAAGTQAARIDAATFVRMAMSSNLLEIESSRMAVQQSRRQDVKAFAQMMIDDHTDASETLQQAVAQSGAPAATSTGRAAMVDKHQAMMQQLTQAQGDGFDRAYVQLQRSAHQEAVALFTTYAQSGDDRALKSLATELLPVLQKHAEAANALGR